MPSLISLTDLISNIHTMPAEMMKALYVKELILGPGSVLNTAFNHVYYESLTMDPTARMVNVPLLGFFACKYQF